MAKALVALLNRHTFQDAADASSLHSLQSEITSLLYASDPAALRGFPGLPRHEYAPESSFFLMIASGWWQPGALSSPPAGERGEAEALLAPTAVDITRFFREANAETNSRLLACDLPVLEHALSTSLKIMYSGRCDGGCVASEAAQARRLIRASLLAEGAECHPSATEDDEGAVRLSTRTALRGDA